MEKGNGEGTPIHFAHKKLDPKKPLDFSSDSLGPFHLSSGFSDPDPFFDLLTFGFFFLSSASSLSIFFRIILIGLVPPVVRC